MNCINTVFNGEKSEITCLSYLKGSNLFVTGHDTGDIKLWNLELNSSIILEQSNLIYRHINTVCCLYSEQMKTSLNNDSLSEYLFSSGYDGRINI
jgi:WD40 repeat protein